MKGRTILAVAVAWLSVTGLVGAGAQEANRAPARASLVSAPSGAEAYRTIAGVVAGVLSLTAIQGAAQDAPGSLQEGVVVDLVAYLLQENGYPAGARELPPLTSTLDRIRIVARLP